MIGWMVKFKMPDHFSHQWEDNFEKRDIDKDPSDINVSYMYILGM